jgi:hypothetical protein
MEQLFGSKTRVKLLKLFLSSPNRSYFVREITRKIDEQINSVRRELGNLLNIGILKSHEKDNKLYYEINQTYEHYDALRAIFGNAKFEAPQEGEKKVTKVAAKDKDLQAALKELGQVDILVYLGSFTNDERIGIDVLMVGDINKTKAHNYMADLEEIEGRELKYTVLTTDEFVYRKDVNDRFVGMVMLAKKSVMHDPHGLIEEK